MDKVNKRMAVVTHEVLTDTKTAHKGDVVEVRGKDDYLYRCLTNSNGIVPFRPDEIRFIDIDKRDPKKRIANTLLMRINRFRKSPSVSKRVRNINRIYYILDSLESKSSNVRLLEEIKASVILITRYKKDQAWYCKDAEYYFLNHVVAVVIILTDCNITGKSLRTGLNEVLNNCSRLIRSILDLRYCL